MTLNKKLIRVATALAVGGAIAIGTDVAVAQNYGSTAGASSTSAAPAAGVALRDVVNPKVTLANAKIQDQSGTSIGTVNDVLLDANGRPSEIKADVGGFLGIGSKVVAMKASDFKFDKDHKVLMTSLNKSQIQAMPEAKS
jgi:hypothetical protein